MKTIDILIPIVNLKFERLNATFEIGPFKISNNNNHIEDFFNRGSNLEYFGKSDYLAAKKYCSITYFGSENELSMIAENDDLYLKGHKIQGYIKFLLHSLWFIKDNCINTQSILVSEGGFYIRSTMDTLVSHSYKESNNISVISCADIKNAMDISSDLFHFRNQLNGPTYSPTKDDESIIISSMNNVIYDKKINRITRALMLAEKARFSSFLPEKIKYYIMTLECLFLTGKKDLKKQTALKPILYLQDDIENHRFYYKAIEDAYDIRSSYVHGDYLLNKLAKPEILSSCSSTLNELLRLSLLKMMKNPDGEPFFEGNSKKIDVWFKDKTHPSLI